MQISDLVDCLCLGPADLVVPFGISQCGRTGWMRRSGFLVAVLHRSDETWTHLYRIEMGGRVVVHLERAAPGDAVVALRDWAAKRYGLPCDTSRAADAKSVESLPRAA